MVDGRDMAYYKDMEAFIVAFMAEHGNAPSLHDLWLWKEARASIALDKGDDGGTSGTNGPEFDRPGWRKDQP